MFTQHLINEIYKLRALLSQSYLILTEQSALSFFTAHHTLMMQNLKILSGALRKFIFQLFFSRNGPNEIEDESTEAFTSPHKLARY